MQDYLFPNLKSESIFIPIYVTESSTSRWASFDERVHSVVLWDEFDPNTVGVNSFKLCTEGADFSSDVKYEDAKRIHIRMCLRYTYLKYFLKILFIVHVIN